MFLQHVLLLYPSKLHWDPVAAKPVSLEYGGGMGQKEGMLQVTYMYAVRSVGSLSKTSLARLAVGMLAGAQLTI